MHKRLKEIAARKAEIRKLLESDQSADLDALEKELRDLDNEAKELERRANIAAGISSGEITGNQIKNPAANRSAESDDNGEKEYRSAWLKSIRGIELSEAEKRAMTTITSSAGSAVPTVTENKIVDKVHQYCPLISKIDLLKVPGGVTIPTEGSTTDAKKHTEGTKITADDEALGKVTLAAYEITKLVTISKSVEKMSIDAFETWLVDKIARKISERISYVIMYGTGTGEAQGFDKITWNATNSVEVAASAALTEADVMKAVALLNGGYDNGAEWMMSKTTFFTDFHPLMNKSKNNVVTEDNGTYRIVGYPVSFDDRFKAHESFLCNLYRGYVGNMPESVSVTSQFVTRENAYDFLGCAMFDGKVQAVEAFVKVFKKTA